MSQGPHGLKSPAGEGRAGSPGLDARRDPGGDRRRASGLGHDSLIFLAVVVLAFGLRTTYVLQWRHSPLFDSPQMDAAYHDRWAQAIIEGKTFVEGPYFRAPLYPFFLAAIYRVCGHDYLAPRIIQGLLGSISCGMVFLIGRRAFSRKVGALAGFAAATYWMLIYFDAELLIPTLIVFLDLLMILLLLRAADNPSGRSYGLAGLVLGLSAIARPNVLLFAPAVVLWLAIRHRPAWRRVATWASCFALGCLLPVLPVAVRNYVVGKDLVLIASQGGVNFYIGNNPVSNGQVAVVPGTPGDWWGGYQAAIKRAEDAVGHALRPSEVSRYYFGEAVAFFRAQPGKALRLTARKLWLFWNTRELPNNKGIYFWTERFAPVVKWLPLSFAVMGPLSILGLVLCWRRRQELFPVWGFILVYMVSVVMFFCSARYRTPVLGPLMVLAAHAFLCLAEAVRRARWWDLVRQLAVLALAAVFVNAIPAQDRLANRAQDLRKLGLAYERLGRHQSALEQFRRAVQANPGWLTARYNLGTTLAQLGRSSEAIEQLRIALGLTPHMGLGETAAVVASVHHNLANVLHQRGQHQQALWHYRKAIDLDPAGGEAVTYFRLGNTLAALGRQGEAADALRQAIARDPDHQDAQYNLARVLARSGKLDEAAVHFREVLRLDPQDAEAWHELGLVLVAQGRRAEAIEALQRSVQLHPQNASAVEALGRALMQEARYAQAIDVLTGGLPLEDELLTNTLAWLLATCPDDKLRDGARAVRYASQLCPEVSKCHPTYLDTLAAALAEARRFNEAADVARQALQQARESGDDDLSRSIAARLQLYEAGKPFHQPRP